MHAWSYSEIHKATRRGQVLRELKELLAQKYEEAADIEAKIQRIRQEDPETYFYPETAQ